MSKILKGNGNGNGTSGLLQSSQKRTPQQPSSAPTSQARESRVTFQTPDGLELHGVPARITRHQIVFEIYGLAAIPQLSEALNNFTIILQARTVYSGRAVISNVVDAGTKILCEATLDEAQWSDLNQILALQKDGQIVREFESFLTDWQKLYKVLPEYKVVLADMQTFLADLRLWLEQVEAGIRASSSANRIELERETAQRLGAKIVPVINTLFEQFEAVSNRVDEDLIPAHRAFGKRQLHPLLLCSPFVYRTFAKPLGYAGDYEMVNMMFRDPLEGGSLFAKIINLYALQLPPIIGHRNRIMYLNEQLVKESLRLMVRRGRARVFNLGCGPAHEVQRFLMEDEASDYTHFTLVDFNQETLQHAKGILDDLKRRFARRTTIQMELKTVYQLIKTADRTVYPSGDLYDVVYCAGLFDYLSDQVCRELMRIFYDMLAPGGLLIVTNVDDHPARNEMECFLEWHLVHRNTNRMRSMIPRKAIPEDVLLKRDPTGVNVFMEVRKPGGET